LTKNYKEYSETADNDVILCIHPESGFVDTFSFRADLREPKLKFLFAMTVAGKSHDWVFVDLHGNTALPEKRSILSLARKSEDHRFLLDSEKFIRGLLDEE